jgi:hypothetical protein
VRSPVGHEAVTELLAIVGQQGGDAKRRGFVHGGQKRFRRSARFCAA